MWHMHHQVHCNFNAKVLAAAAAAAAATNSAE
jgi:hypothetical protein